MNHLTEEQLVLHYYGEEGDVLSAERHLDDCQECRETYSSLQRVLNVVDSLPVPERGPEYGAEVWRRVVPAISARRRWFGWLPVPSFEWRWAAAAAAMAGLVAAAFFPGRH
jgi:anti-sigma factor RsiW